MSQEKKNWAENICWYEWLFKQCYIFNVSVILISIPYWKFRAPICKNNLHLWEHWPQIIRDLRITMIIGILGEPIAFWWILHCPLIWYLFLCVKNLTMGFCSFILKAPVQCLGIFTPTLVEMAITNFLCSTSVQFSRSVMSDFLQPMDCSTLQASLSFTNSQSLLKLRSIGLVMSSNHLILCHPLLFLPSIFPSIRVFSDESALRVRWPKYWSFSFNISLSNEHLGLISLRMDWLDLLAVQGTHKSIFVTQNYLLNVLKGQSVRPCPGEHWGQISAF